MSKENIIDDIAFLRKGQYELYRHLGYKCSFLMQNYILNKSDKKTIKTANKIIDIGMYPLNYTWDKNIFNQLCIPKFIENSTLNYNLLNERMKDFVTTMEIKSKEDNIKKINDKSLIDKVIKNDINISCSFTEYLHPLFFISMEQGVPCIIGNTSDLFNCNEELNKYIVTLAEDNAIENANLVINCLANKEKVIDLYKLWKNNYNKIAMENINAFIEA